LFCICPADAFYLQCDRNIVERAFPLHQSVLMEKVSRLVVQAFQRLSQYGDLVIGGRKQPRRGDGERTGAGRSRNSINARPYRARIHPRFHDFVPQRAIRI